MNILSSDIGKILLPYIVIELLLVIVSWTHILKHRSFKRGNTTIWLIVTLVIQFVGPILYFTIGKEE